VEKLRDLKTFSEYQNTFAKMDPQELGKILMEGMAEDIISRNLPIDFYSACIDRLWEFSFLDSPLTEEERNACSDFAEHAIGIARGKCKGHPEVLKRFNEAIEKAKNYYSTVGKSVPLTIQD